MRSQDDWHEGKENAEIAEEILPALELVRKAAHNKIRKFNKQIFAKRIIMPAQK